MISGVKNTLIKIKPSASCFQIQSTFQPVSFQGHSVRQRASPARPGLGPTSPPVSLPNPFCIKIL